MMYGTVLTTTPPGLETTTSDITPAYVICPWYVAFISGVTSGFSVIGAILIFLTYFRFPQEERTFVRKLLLYLTIANCIEVLGNFVGVFRFMNYPKIPDKQPTEASCFFQSFTVSFAPAASYLWTSVIAIFFHVQLLKPECVPCLSSTCGEAIYHAICWFVPGIAVFLAMYYNVFGQDVHYYADIGCWIRSDIPRSDVIMWMLLTNKIWQVVSLFILSEAVCYLVFITKIKPRLGLRRGAYQNLLDEAENEARNERLRSRDRNFMYIWLVVFIIRFCGHLRFYIIAANANNDIRMPYRAILQCLQEFGDSAQAFVNFIVFCLCDKDARRRLCACGANLNQEEMQPINNDD